MSNDTPHSSLRGGTLTVILLLLGFCAVFGSLIGAYVYKFDRQLAEENTVRLAVASDTLAAHMTTVVTDMQTAMDAMARAVALLGTDAERLAYLRDMAALYHFAYMGYAGADGVLRATVPAAARNVRNESCFQAARNGQRFVSGQVRLIFPTRAATGIILSTPLPAPEGGALTAMLETKTLRKTLDLESFNGAGSSFVVEKNGTVIMRTRKMDFGNLFKAWKNEHFIGKNGLDRLMADVEAGRRGLTSFVDMAGRRQYVSYQPLPFNDWTVVTVVAERAVSAKTIAMTREMALIGGLLVLLFMGLLFWALRAHALSRESRLAMDAKSAFLANMSHEIRTPMNAIVGLSEIMLRGNVSPRQNEQLMNILNSGKGLLTIIDDILDISKIEAGKFTIVDEPYDLETLLYDVTTIAAVRIGDKPVHFLVETWPGLPYSLLGDMGRVKQVLLNLVGNAIKFTERGSVRLILDGERDAEGWRLRMEVRDTGIGIRPDDLDKLFVSFNQVDTRRNRKVKGTGLGLAISRKLCEMMRGTIEVRSEYGKGSSFVATIRQGFVDATPLVAPVAAGVSLLLCEEDDELRAFEDACLARLRIRRDLCSTPAACADRLAHGSYTHVLAAPAVLRGLPDAPEDPDPPKDPTNTGPVHVGLLAPREYALQEMGGANVYVPLFAIQLPPLLSSAAAVCRLSRRSGLNAATIAPLPFVSILIVDDNEVNVQVAEGLMAPYGMRMAHAYSGREAVQAVREGDYDLVLMDHMMPDLDGVETTRLIRALPDEKYRAIPIVALTANVTDETRRLFQDNDFNGFLAKPMETSALDRLLQSLLGDVNARRAALSGAPSATGGPPPAGSVSGTTPARDAAPQAGPHPEVDFQAGAAGLPSAAFYLRVLDMYIHSTGGILSQLPDWLNDDPNRIVIEVHGLKSASVSIGANHFSEAARHLETLGRQGRFDEVRAGLPEFLEHGNRVLREIREYLARQPDRAELARRA